LEPSSYEVRHDGETDAAEHDRAHDVGRPLILIKICACNQQVPSDNADDRKDGQYRMAENGMRNARHVPKDDRSERATSIRSYDMLVLTNGQGLLKAWLGHVGILPIGRYAPLT
jgi:hypothetical protein